MAHLYHKWEVTGDFEIETISVDASPATEWKLYGYGPQKWFPGGKDVVDVSVENLLASL